MSVAAHYALKALVRGIAMSGALNVGQTHVIYDELEEAAKKLDDRGRDTEASEIREMIAYALEGDWEKAKNG